MYVKTVVTVIATITAEIDRLTLPAVAVECVRTMHSFGGAAEPDVIMTSHKGRYWPGWGGVLGACMIGGIMLLRKQVN